MDKIIEKYFIFPGSVLVHYTIGTNGVDCWFDSEQWRNHRCLSFEDFELIKPLKVATFDSPYSFQLNGDMAQQFNETYAEDEFEDDGAYANDYL